MVKKKKKNIGAIKAARCLSEAHQSAGHAHHGNGGLGGLGHVQQVVEQGLVLVGGEQVELIQDEEHRAAAAAITWMGERVEWGNLPKKKLCHTLYKH